MSVQIAITGIKELDNVLKMMPRAIDDKFMTAVNKDRAKILEREERARAPVGATHNLQNSIGTVKVRKAQEIGTVRTGPQQRGKRKGFHAKFIEFGFKTRSKGKGKKFVEPNPFVEPAFDTVKGQLQTGITQSIAKVLVRTMRRYLK